MDCSVARQDQEGATKPCLVTQCYGSDIHLGFLHRQRLQRRLLKVFSLYKKRLHVPQTHSGPCSLTVHSSQRSQTLCPGLTHWQRCRPAVVISGMAKGCMSLTRRGSCCAESCGQAVLVDLPYKTPIHWVCLVKCPVQMQACTS